MLKHPWPIGKFCYSNNHLIAVMRKCEGDINPVGFAFGHSLIGKLKLDEFTSESIKNLIQKHFINSETAL